MTRTHEKVRAPRKESLAEHTIETAADGVDRAFSLLRGRWKLLIVFRLFNRRLARFSDLERALPAISQKMLAQQLRQLEHDGIVRRIDHEEVPPKVEYGLTDWGQSLCPALFALLEWIDAVQRQ